MNNQLCWGRPLRTSRPWAAAGTTAFATATAQWGWGPEGGDLGCHLPRLFAFSLLREGIWSCRFCCLNTECCCTRERNSNSSVGTSLTTEVLEKTWRTQWNWYVGNGLPYHKRCTSRSVTWCESEEVSWDHCKCVRPQILWAPSLPFQRACKCEGKGNCIPLLEKVWGFSWGPH